MYVLNIFWVDAVSTVCFLINSMFFSVFNGEIFYRVFFFIKYLFFIVFKIFGCVCFVRDVRFHYIKLDFNFLKCIFLGYLRVQKGYRCYCFILNSYLVLSDVVFFEDIFFILLLSSLCQGEDDNFFIYEVIFFILFLFTDVFFFRSLIF